MSARHAQRKPTQAVSSLLRTLAFCITSLYLWSGRFGNDALTKSNLYLALTIHIRLMTTFCWCKSVKDATYPTIALISSSYHPASASVSASQSRHERSAARRNAVRAIRRRRGHPRPRMPPARRRPLDQALYASQNARNLLNPLFQLAGKALIPKQLLEDGQGGSTSPPP